MSTSPSQKSHHVPLPPPQQKILTALGDRIHMARKRRKITINDMASRANISRQTVWKIEHGDSGVSIGAYLKVLNGLGMKTELNKIIEDDPLGRLLQDERDR
ncbi:MAG: helix-turn-helix transcriptional regulator [Lachnospiraceae bacterium]|jgi:transcriptional regulator with XRE-family HTH domain|nr:helix-turn-helix transcriptional regulator [Lachnospiraceae bacterium]MEE3461208.1 helix-turn-helix transcriptional regulator [Lachnospiraceae bacterium]